MRLMSFEGADRIGVTFMLAQEPFCHHYRKFPVPVGNYFVITIERLIGHSHKKLKLLKLKSVTVPLGAFSWIRLLSALLKYTRRPQEGEFSKSLDGAPTQLVPQMMSHFRKIG